MTSPKVTRPPRSGRAAILWLRAPLLLRRFPQILGITVLSAAILAIATASGPAFLQSSETASLRTEVAEISKWGAGLRAGYSSGFGIGGPTNHPHRDAEKMREIEDTVAAEMTQQIEDVPHLGPVGTTLVSAISLVTTPEGQKDVRLVHREGALDHVEQISSAGDPTDGIWLADVTAEQIGAEPGDVIEVSGPTRERDVRVAGTSGSCRSTR